MSQVQEFSVGYEQFDIKGDQFSGASDREILLLHGAGASNRSRISMLRSAFSEQGIGSTAFDFVGHGDTGGQLAQSSLSSRTRQAQAVIAARGLQGPLNVVGVSMGAYNAIKLTQSMQVSSLILVVPGVYVPTAYDIPFGPDFSTAIRYERSWANTDAWEILSAYKGRLLVIAAENDVVIPREIPERLFASASNAQWRKLLVVEGGEHKRIFALLQEHPERYQATLDLIAECIEGR